ncbi:hypothetical protein [Photorhabdus sp. RM323S]
MRLIPPLAPPFALADCDLDNDKPELTSVQVALEYDIHGDILYSS